MTDGSIFHEIFPASLTRYDEEVCGDQVKILRTDEKSMVVLSDGLGNGIKAAILARMTTEIIVTMLREGAPLGEVIETVAGTLPVCRVRNLAYATFAIIQIHHADSRFELVSFDSPPPILLRQKRAVRLETHQQTLGGKVLSRCEGTLVRGDFLGLMSDGVLFASPGVTMDASWGWEAIAACLEHAVKSGRNSAEGLVQAVIRETQKRYGPEPGEDATLVGVLARQPRRLMVFTGPPGDKSRDAECVTRLLRFEGRRVVCGGTTGNLVADQAGDAVETDETTAREGIPAVGSLPGVDLVTEGILTLSRALEILQRSQGNPRRLPVDRNGAVLLCRELLRADSILLLAGESVNPYYQNPQLPRSISIRRSLVTQIAQTLTAFHKDVRVEWR
jgi:hypothetical protein